MTDKLTVRLLDGDKRSTLFRNREALVITNSREFALALGKATGVGITALLPERSLCLADLLAELAVVADVANAAIVIDPAIQLRDMGSPSPGGGLELLKHIRLSVATGAARCRPIGVGVRGSVDTAIRSKPDNVLALAPGSYPLCVPFTFEALLRFFAEAQEIRDIRHIQDFVIYGSDDTASSVHDYRNKAGLATFISEFAGDVLRPDHPMVIESNRRRAASLWLKKRDFMERMLTAETSPQEPIGEAQELRTRCRGRHFLFVDDEHDAGWCSALYAGLFGKEPPEHDALAPDLRCFGTETESMKFLDTVEQEWNEWLDGWRRAEHEKQQAVRASDAAQTEEQALATKVRAAEKLAADARLRRENAVGNCARARAAYLERLNEAAVRFADLYTRDAQVLPDDETISRLLAELDAARRVFESTHSTESKETIALGAAAAQLEEQATRHQRAADQAKKCAERRSRAEQELRVLSTRRFVLPFDLAFLDLRLDAADVTRVEDVSGTRILRRIHRLDPTFPVIVFSASNAIASYRASLESGVEAYWIKGVSTGLMATDLVCAALSRDAIREFWLDVKRVESKREIVRISFDKGAVAEEPMPTAHRESMIMWLYHSLAELQKTEPDFAAMIRDLGIVQELRYWGLHDDKWRSKESQLPNQDRQLREVRNRVSHPKNSMLVERGAALELLKFTIHWLLDDTAVPLARKLARN